MANLIEKTGGTSPIDGQRYFAQDFIDSTNSVVDLSALGVAQMAYQMLRNSGSIQNEDFLFADRFTTSVGVKSTVDESNTTAKYRSATDLYECVEDLSAYTYDSNFGVTDFSNISDRDTTTNISHTANEGTFRIDILFSSRLIGDIYVNASSGGSNNWIISRGATVQTYDGSTWTTVHTGTSSIDQTISINDTIQGIRVNLSINASDDGTVMRSYAFRSIDFLENYTDSVVKCDDVISMSGDEKGLLIYALKDTPANTSITYDVTDGTTTLTDLELNTVNPIGSLSSGNLDITFNLNTTDSTVTPKIYGYGGYMS